QVVEIVREEEESFIRTLDRGIKLFEEAAAVARLTESGFGEKKEGIISGEVAFRLHDTYGVYIDITEQMAVEAGLSVDRKGYEEEMRKAKEKARGARKKLVVAAISGELPETEDSPKYGGPTCNAHLVGGIKDNTVVRSGRLKE